MSGTRRDSLKWVAAGFALVATASAEYDLAQAVGMNQWIAAAVPGALDAYVVRSLKTHREVLTAVLAMVGVNAASHLVTAGMLPVGWQLVTAVSAIAPLVLWRVHALGTPGEARRRAIWGVRAHEHTAGTEEHERVPDDQGTPNEREHPEHTSTFEEHAAEALGVARWDVCVHGHAVCEGFGGACTVYKSVPEDEHTDVTEHGDTSTSLLKVPAPVLDAVHADVNGTSTPEHAPVLTVVPPLPSTFTASSTVTSTHEHVSTGVLHPSDTPYLDPARVLAQEDALPTVRALKEELSVGTPRAQRLLCALKAERAGTEGEMS